MPAWSTNRIFTWASPACCQLQMDFPEFVSHFGITLHPSYPRFQAAARISQLAPAAGLIHPKPSGKKAFSLVGLLTLTEIILAGMEIAFPHVAAPVQTVFHVSAHVFEITSLALLRRGYRGGIQSQDLQSPFLTRVLANQGRARDSNPMQIDRLPSPHLCPSSFQSPT
ncbi:hypothetical protein MHYP_G00181670 [Metynnis hypsauchen]